jgi:hypothetical protein
VSPVVIERRRPGPRTPVKANILTIFPLPAERYVRGGAHLRGDFLPAGRKPWNRQQARELAAIN